MKFSLSVILLGTVFAINVDARAIDEIDHNGNVDCYIRFLKTENLLESSFPENGSNRVEDCDEAVNRFIRSAYRNIATEIHLDEDSKNVMSCIMSKLRKNKVAEHLMVEKVYELTTSLTEIEKEKKIEDAETNVGGFMLASLQNCMLAKRFRDFFDGFFENKKETTDSEIYCKRKYVVDHNLLNQQAYNFEINPYNTDFGALDCEALLNPIFDKKDAEMIAKMKNGGTDEDQMNCALKALSDGNVNGHSLVVDVLVNIDLTEAQKDFERERFVTASAGIAKVMMTCVAPELGEIIRV